jgi:hypothetical protein
MRRAYEALSSDEERESFMNEVKAERSETIRGAIARVMMRNQSHNVGKHLGKARKN